MWSYDEQSMYVNATLSVAKVSITTLVERMHSSSMRDKEAELRCTSCAIDWGEARTIDE